MSWRGCGLVEGLCDLHSELRGCDITVLNI
ncbi:hypothetical protein M3J09_013086 [Ascochyta lentis]